MSDHLAKTIFCLFFGPKSNHCLVLSLTHSLTDPFGPDCKQMWKFWSFFHWNLIIILKTHFISLWRVSKIHFSCPFGGCKWSSKGVGVPQAAVKGWIWDSSSWMKMTYFLRKIRFRTHVIRILGQKDTKNHKKLNVRGRGVNAHGHPDHKMFGFFSRLS